MNLKMNPMAIVEGKVDAHAKYDSIEISFGKELIFYSFLDQGTVVATFEAPKPPKRGSITLSGLHGFIPFKVR